MRSNCTILAVFTIFASRSLRSNCTILAIFTIFASRSLRSNCTILAVFTIFARVTFEIRVALQGILIQGYQYPFIPFSFYFLCFQAVTEVKLQAADGRSGYKAAGRVAAAAPLAAAVDVDGQASHTLQLSHVHGVGIRKPGRHTRDLAGMGLIAYRNRCPGGFPGLVVNRFAGTLLQRIIAFHVFIRRSHRPAAKGHATIVLDIGIVPQQDSVGNTSGEDFIRSTDDNVVLHIFVHGVIVTDDDQVVTFLGFGAVSFAQSTIFRICRESLA